MAVIVAADIEFIGPQVLEKLLATPEAARYTFATGSDSEFQIVQEIRDNILIVDERICVEDIIGTPGHPWRQKFMQWSTGIASGVKITDTVCPYGFVQTKVGSADYEFSTQAKNRDEILRMIKFKSLYSNLNFHWIEDGVVLTPADTAKVQYAEFTRTAACQAPATATAALIYGSIQQCEKRDSGSDVYSDYGKLFEMARPYIRQNQIIPPAEQLEMALDRKAA